DSCIQDDNNVFPALPSRRAWNVGVRQLVDQADLRLAPKNGVAVHFLESAATIFQLLAGNRLETFGFGDGVLASMFLEIADHDVDALLLEFLAFLQHPVGFACAGRVSQKNFEFAAHIDDYCGKILTSILSASSINLSTFVLRKFCNR